MEKRPILAVTMGDPAGIGAEIALKALAHAELYEACQPFVVGDAAVLRRAMAVLGLELPLNLIDTPAEIRPGPGCVNVLSLGAVEENGWAYGQVSAHTGHASYLYIEKAIRLALAKEADAVVTGPINKEALNLGGHHYAGHTEIFAELTGAEDFAMLLTSPSLRVIHLSTHVSMRDACDLVSEERVYTVIRLAKQAMGYFGIANPRIAVAGLNAHSSENGMFGSEEAEAIIPAIERARAEGMDITGPVPPDTVFVKAVGGLYDIVVAMYHDQGHIPVKLSGFKMDPATGEFVSVNGINMVIGLPIIRTSVDHGTAYDIAGKGIANEDSMLDALYQAANMALGRIGA